MSSSHEAQPAPRRADANPRGEQRLPEEVQTLMETFVPRLRDEVGDLLVGVYVVGSATSPDYEPASSDIDVCVVLCRQLNPNEVERLRKLHRTLPEETPQGGNLELDYIAQDQLRPSGAEGDVVSISPGEQLRTDHNTSGADDIWGARELGVPVFGPPPREVFPKVDRETLAQSMREWLDDLVSRGQRSHASGPEYAEWTLNIARCLFGITHGRGSTKPEAAEWLARQEPDLRPALDVALAARRGEQIPHVAAATFREYAEKADSLAKLKLKNGSDLEADRGDDAKIGQRGTSASSESVVPTPT